MAAALLGGGGPACAAEATNAAAATVAPAREARFEQSAPYGSAAELKRRFRSNLVLPTYDVRKERFRIIVPAGYSTNGAWGLLVWISPGEEARIPPAWDRELAEQRLLFVGADNSGNERDTLDRCRLALDGVCNMSRRYRVDPKRIYVGGFSGGARIASMLGVVYADLFAGTVCVCGVDFYQPVPAGAGGYYLAGYTPEPGQLLRAKANGRFVLLTGETDINRDNTKSTAENGFRPAGFKYVKYLEVAGMAHALPPAPVLKSALEYLSGDKP